MEKTKIKNLVLIPLFSIIISVCAWICIPSVIPFTLQTFGVFFTLLYLGGKRGTISVSLYIALGAIGFPFFSGGTGGFGILFGATGGFIFGMLLIAVVFWLFEKYARNIKNRETTSLLVGLLFCYFFGVLQFYAFWSAEGDSVTLLQIFTIYIIPYLLPDLLKIYLAIYFDKKIKKFISD